MSGIVLKNEHIIESDNIVINKPPWLQEKINRWLKRGNNYLTISPVHRPRTTGEKSQNNYYWKLISYLVEYTGSDSGYLHSIIKSLAVGMGYPQKIIGERKAFLPFTDMPDGIDFREASVKDAIILIQCAENQCLDLGINIEKE